MPAAEDVRRAVDWDRVRGEILLLDQTLLPAEVRVLRVRDVSELCEAIEVLRVRGAMALGVAGALGVALAARRAAEAGEEFRPAVLVAADRLRATRPTAVNLGWGIDQVVGVLDGGADAVEARALELVEADARANESLAHRGAELLEELLRDRRRGYRILTHCNAGALAAVEWGSALGIVRAAHEQGRVAEVFACETRPLLQGARLTAWELARLGVPCRVLVDGAGPALLTRGLVDVVVVGADRIAANGDTANKIGTLTHALGAARAGVPFVVAAPESTIDRALATGADIPIEERGAAEVLSYGGGGVALPGVGAWNPAFDVTPADLVTAIVTDRRVVRVDRGERPDGPVPAGP
jgi:methylthioribose-1-phosphate isomerase